MATARRTRGIADREAPAAGSRTEGTDRAATGVAVEAGTIPP